MENSSVKSKFSLNYYFSSSASGESNCSISSGSLGGGAVGASISFEEVRKATNNFSLPNKLGEGGFGTVYKGKLKNGAMAAFKRAKKDKHENHLFAECKNEFLTLSKIEHLNLVRLYGYVEHEDEQVLVLEYVNNGNLREHLDGARGFGLEAGERLDIAIDVAHAITYLHMYTDHPLIHRDIKASNILITDKLRAKVADFGFARPGVESSSYSGATHISTHVKGTTGYLDPEYVKTFQLSEKSDVYSFGVLLVELATGRNPLEPNRSFKQKVTAKWAMRKLKEGEIVFAMDPRLRRSPSSVTAIEKILRLARHCLAPQRQLRPSMKHCAEVLWEIRKNYQDAQQPISHAVVAAARPHSENIAGVRKLLRRNMFRIDEQSTFLSA